MNDPNWRPARRRGFVVPALVAALAAGLWLRTWRTEAPFQAGDYANIPYGVSQTWATQCVLGHPYGPVLPGMVLLFARAVTALGFAMNEVLWRLPLGLIGAGHVVVTYLLMRRMGAATWTAVLAAGFTAALPGLVTDARYPWGYESLGACVGSLALWAWLRDLDRPSRFRAWVAGILLAAYLSSHLLVYAVPVVTLAACVLAGGGGAAVRRWTRLSTLLPLLGAAVIPYVALVKFGGGVVGRLRHHAGMGTLVLHVASPGTIAGWSVTHLGWPWAVWCAVGVVAGLLLLWRGDRRGLAALWCVVSVAPFPFLVDMSHIGRPTSYLLQAMFAATLAGCVLVEVAFDAVRQLSARQVVRCKVAVAVVACGMLALQFAGAIVNQFTERRWAGWTGSIDYGRAIDDPGYKAAGWFVRTRVPADAVVLATHGLTGLEYPCASYYLGRHVAAAEDTTDEQERRLIRAVRGRIDYAVVEPRFEDLFTADVGFAAVARIEREGRELLTIVRRGGGDGTVQRVDVREADAAYDRMMRPQAVPTLMAANPRTRGVNREIQRVLAGAGDAIAAAGGAR